jgi:large subunit ribosomal protein L30
MKMIRIKQVRSKIGRPLRQKRTLEALGIRKMHQVREVPASPEIIGMIEKVKHLLEVEEL